MHHELLVVQFNAEKKVILIAWDRVPSRLVRRRTSFTAEWSTRNWQSTLVGTGLMTPQLLAVEWSKPR